MLAPELKSVLAGLCRGHGWLYGVVWRVEKCDPPLLVVEDVYCEEQVQGVVEKILNQVHIVGEGILGRSVANGKDKWIFHDTYQTECSKSLNADDPKYCQGDIEWIQQQLDGFKTVALCSLPSFGLLQFGSTKKIPQSLEFVAQAKVLLGLKFSKAESHYDAKCTSPYFTRECNSNYENNSLQKLNGGCLSNLQLIRRMSQSSSNFLDEFLQDSSSHDVSMNSHEIRIPVTTYFTSFDNQFQEPSISSKSMFQLPSHTVTVNGDPQVFLSGSSNVLSTFSSPENAVVPPATGSPVVPNVMPLSSLSPILDERVFSRCSAELSSCIQQNLQYPIPDTIYSGMRKNHHSSEPSFTLPQAGQFMPNVLFHQPSFSSGHNNTHIANVEDLTTLHSFLENDIDDLTLQSNKLPSQTVDNAIASRNLPVITASSGSAKNDFSFSTMANSLSRMSDNNMASLSVNSMNFVNNYKEGPWISSTQNGTDSSLFECMDFDLNPSNFLQDYWEHITALSSCTSVTTSVSGLHTASVLASEKEMFLESGPEMLASVVRKNDDNTSTDNCVVENVHAIAGLCLDNQVSTISNNLSSRSVNNNQVPSGCMPSLGSFKMLTGCKPDVQGSPKEALPKAILGSKIDDCCSISTANSLLNPPKKTEESSKVAKKRARPGESTRPRPKDRQQIQDRVKELREIVPNGAKCSIDALLDRTIKHMLFLQSVTKYADKLRQDDEPKMIVEESGVVLKDNSGSTGSGGATWAYEVAGQTMVCPIIVEDLSPPGQMLVEMLCEERGFFLEIADIIRGFGLVILKGVMEIRSSKIWARFVVETNRDVTRMDIFLSLVQLLQQTNSLQSCEQETRISEKGTHFFNNYEQPPKSVPVHHSDKL